MAELAHTLRNGQGFGTCEPPAGLDSLFTDPKIAHVGLSERQARERYGDATRVLRWPIERIDRAITEGDIDGFLELVHLLNGRILGGTIVWCRAGELADELSLAVSRR